ncbi:MAG TPA: hypothetical protein DDY25_00045 [Peptococcaceae bacterium]|nr:hypothetical protein [Peptococcaceae bacterium]
MNIKPSTALRNEYTQISELAKELGEPIVITNKGEADLVIMSVEAYEEREKMFHHRDGYSRQFRPAFLCHPANDSRNIRTPFLQYPASILILSGQGPAPHAWSLT